MRTREEIFEAESRAEEYLNRCAPRYKMDWRSIRFWHRLITEGLKFESKVS